MGVFCRTWIPVLAVYVASGCSTSVPARPGTGAGGSAGGVSGSGQAGTNAGPGAGGTMGMTDVDAGGAGSGGGGTSSGTAGTTALDASGTAGSGPGGASVGGAGGAPAFPMGDPGTTGDGDLTISPPYATQADLTDKGNSKGKSFHLVMDSANSTLFKGDDPLLKAANQHTFMRGIDVYVPAAYKDGTQAPVLVIQDGPGELGQVKNALDNLTISKDPARKLPAFVAIAVANGGGDARGSERGLEYDTMSDRYARFVQSEVLPAVIADAKVKAAYPNLSFTDNPEGKAAMGCSSGGAAALSMGWFRPDLFRRIITYSGTFVAQQNDTAPEHALFPDGAWDYHSAVEIIANTPRKDLRVFLNVNQMDNGATSPETGHHNWVLANQRTAAALMAKGYHHRFVFAMQAGHCQGNVRSSTLADSLVWAWQGYPPP
jgi:iron(III)-enterobactin esterase